MNRNEGNELYLKAQKLALRDYREKMLAGQSPFLPVLDDILQNVPVENQIPLGQVDIPLNLLVGTKTTGRTAAFASNFMPLLDLKTEFASKWVNLCLSHLEEGIRDAILDGKQSILFLNRRGNSRYLVCMDCGDVPQCPRCSVHLTYHSSGRRLMCHYCGNVMPAHARCEKCGAAMTAIGSGTQKVEQELKALFPDTEVLRMDADTVPAAGGHEAMLKQFREQQIPILLGTQMVAKGLDFEKVTLVGVLGIDSLLFGQGFRAYESVFSLITQVVGRGGRAELPGRALIQTCVPDHPVLQLAAAQDYEGFYREEITFRRFGLYPPFCSFVVVGFVGDQEGAVFIAAQRFGALLAQHAAQKPNIPLRVLGPAPMNITMLNNKYRYKLTLKCRNDAAFRGLLHETLDAYDAEKLPQKASVVLDFNSDGDL